VCAACALRSGASRGSRLSEHAFEGGAEGGVAGHEGGYKTTLAKLRDVGSLEARGLAKSAASAGCHVDGRRCVGHSGFKQHSEMAGKNCRDRGLRSMMSGKRMSR
jgi:hypothetical protein